MIFEGIKHELEIHQFEIISKDMNRPWGAFFIIADERHPSDEDNMIRIQDDFGV